MRTIELGSDMHCKIEVPHRLECDFRIGIATARLPPRHTRAFERPSRIASTASTALWPLLRGGSNPKTRASPSRSASFGISVMPTVRSPCTFEWPRSGRNARALAPDIAAEHQQIGDLLHIARAVTMLGDPHAVIDDDPAPPWHRYCRRTRYLIATDLRPPQSPPRTSHQDQPAAHPFRLCGSR